MQIVGKIKVINPDQQISENFRKREFVITTDEQYPQHIAIELHQDKVDLLDPYNVGDLVKVSINIRGREWVNPQGEYKYFNTILAWKIERMNSQNSEIPKATPQQAFDQNSGTGDEHDDLPF